MLCDCSISWVSSLMIFLFADNAAGCFCKGSALKEKNFLSKGNINKGSIAKCHF